jgi:hypothetical protein
MRQENPLQVDQTPPCVILSSVYDAAGEHPKRSFQLPLRQIFWAGLIMLAIVLVAPTTAQAKKLVISEAIEITGKIQRPQAMYILQRSKLNLKGLQLRRSLIPKLLESMRKPPL